ncbi:MAG TPA: valine--tRNA ligase [Halanaerobiales bacterium]|nr:valine--tRNA ligase [Halanaerobiales bacterium]
MENLPKNYDPDKVEDKWYDYWMENGLFEAEVDKSKEPFSIVMPPPNITGQLHMGHALDNTLQDILTRWKRMKGFASLWLPGTDHASIATEVKVVDKLRNEGIDKDEIGREGFLEKAWEWKEEYGNRITNQLKKMGSSCDWSRERFTMDEGCSEAVKEVFIQLYEKGLIYQGDYIVNWCPSCHTTLSDVEVEHEEHEGKLYYIKYPIKDSDDYITVATTRPETMLGDTAIAVNPSDERYKDLVGKTVILPLMEREIPVIADPFVDSDFGTGMVKVTPAHDPNDFDMGERNDLEVIKVIDEDANMTEVTNKYAGMDRYECRDEVIKDLKEEELLVKIDEHEHSVGQCYRCDTVIEPLVSKQWFVKMEPLAKPAIDAVKEGDIKFIPERFSKVYLNWMENIKDWCISRQLWWGHRIPVWYCQDCGEVIVRREEPAVCPNCESSDLKQDEDVLDTWFSSALWPFSTLGWPEETKDLDFFYPTDVLVTGRDIIFFWVARMIFMGLEFMDEVPFDDVYVHGLIRDAQGRKMSKSLGNGIDPIEVIEEYGADALRFTLITGNTPGNDMRFREERLEASRNFANKIWNASRFILMNLEDLDYEEINEEELKLNLADKWMLSRTNEVTQKIDEAMERYSFGEMSKSLYDFIWNEYCDWYIEILKERLYQDKDLTAKKTAQYMGLKILGNILKLLHPVMPMITEEIWQKLPISDKSLMITSWPEYNESEIDKTAEEKMDLIMSVIKSVRNIRNEMKVDPGRKIEAILLAKSSKGEILREGNSYLKNLANIEDLTITGSLEERPQPASTSIVEGVEVILPLEGMVDIEKELDRLQKELKDVKYEIERAKGKLSNEGFVNNAPAELVEGEREKVEEYKEKKEKLLERIKQLKLN